MKYENWDIGAVEEEAASRFRRAGFSELTARVLCSRGYPDPDAARRALACDTPLTDPFAMRQMAQAAARIRRAIDLGQTVAVYGDYDVDGITATCLLTDYLRSRGARCLWYIPDRIGEGYGLNAGAVRQLHAAGAELIVTVDCGITAVDEALLCRTLGMDLIVTDHHECKQVLPPAVAILDPHRPGETYPHHDLSGVGVAFKLVCALEGDARAVLARYCDLVCLGTVADVMPLRGENRVFAARGLEAMQRRTRVGLAALIDACAAPGQPVTATTVGYTLAPRINAAGRLGRVALAVELFLTDDPQKAEALAAELCQLNRRRQAIESEIYTQAVEMLGSDAPPAIVLAGEDWHQGVVGVVASRLAEEYNCPTFLICLDGAYGKASSRSYGGFNLFAGLSSLSGLLAGYGGHELAAGFTIPRENVARFRDEICKQVAAHTAAEPANTLHVDCAVDAQMLTLANVEALGELEPCGEGCPRPVFCIEQMRVEQLVPICAGRHLRLKLRWGEAPRETLTAVYFSMDPLRVGVEPGDLADVAFTCSVNVYRGVRSVQVSLLDIRPSERYRRQSRVNRALYERRLAAELTAREAEQLLPERAEFAAVWHYLGRFQRAGTLEENFECLCRRLSRCAGKDYSMARVRICLDVFEEMGLIRLQRKPGVLHIRITSDGTKINLDDSAILTRLRRCKQERNDGDLSGAL